MSAWKTLAMVLKHSLLFAFLTRLLFTDAQTTVRFVLEAEESHGRHEIMPRTNASSGKTIALKGGETLAVNFCLRVGTNVTLKDVMYSNDGDSDTLIIILDGEPVAQFKTRGQSNFGFLWNYIIPADFEEQFYLDAGWHVLKITQIDEGLVEIDCFNLDIEDLHMDPIIFKCESMCNERKSIALSSNHGGFPALAVQRSYKTECAEEDNVNIPLFHPGIEKFRITASIPEHGSFRNYREEDPQACPHLPSRLFEFKNFSANRFAEPLVHGQASLIFDSRVQSSSSTRLVTIFRLKGKSFGLIDSEIGSVLTLKIRSLIGWAKVGMEYYTKEHVYTEPDENIFNKEVLEHSWTFPDFTWVERDMNFILLTIETEFEQPVIVESLKLVKRPFQPEKIDIIYESDDLIIEGASSDFWWLAPESMTVTLITGERWDGLHYIRMYRPIPWSNGYAQVFVLYQDGNVRLLPLPPDGVDWIPFGTSVIVGQTDPLHIRPKASIQEIRIAPDYISMNVMYNDGASATFDLLSSLRETTLTVDEIIQDPNPTSPFATYRSMYLNMSKSCGDTVVSDDGVSFPVIDEWGQFPGKAFSLQHTCSSTYLTMSPNIKIEILETSGAGSLNETMVAIETLLENEDTDDT